MMIKIVFRALACMLINLTSACVSFDRPEFVGGAPMRLADTGRGVSVRWAWADLGPDAQESYFLLRGTGSDLPLIADPHSSEYVIQGMERSQRRQLMESDLESDISTEVLEELKACTKGGHVVDAIVRVEGMDYYRFGEAGGEDRIRAVVELFETDGSGPIARYSVQAVSPRRFSIEAPYGGEGWFISINDREDSMAERLGREICKETFGSTVRPSWWRNMTS